MVVAICDDEKKTGSELDRYIGKLDTDNEYEVFLYTSGKELIEEYKSKRDIDVFFLDIEVGNENGLEIARKIKDINSSAVIVFITAHHNYVFDVFEVQPVEFIKKPFCEADIRRALMMIKKHVEREGIIRYSARGAKHFIPIKEIVCIESDKRKINVRMQNDTAEFYGKLDEIEKICTEKSNHFVRVNQSALINMRCIKKISFTEVTISSNGEDIVYSISTKYKEKVRKKLMELWI